MADIVAGTQPRHVDAIRSIRSIKFSEQLISQKKMAQPKWYESMSEMLPDEEPMQAPWVDRWVDIEPQQLPIVARWVDIDRVTPSPIIERKLEPMVTPSPIVERKLEPMVTPRGLVMVIITIALTLVIVERLVGGMIYERLASRRKYTFAN
jgi:hypothetical protein